MWEKHVMAGKGSPTDANENHNFANNIDELLGKNLQALRLFSHWWLQLKRCENRCVSSVQDNLPKCHVSWYSEVLRDDPKVPSGLNFIHPLFITTAPCQSNNEWMLKIQFSKHLCSLQSKHFTKNAPRLLVIFCQKMQSFFLRPINPLPLQLYLFPPQFVFLLPWTKQETCSYLFWKSTICDTDLIIFQNISAPCVKAILL